MRDTDRQMKRTGRDIDRDRRELEREEKKLVHTLHNSLYIILSLLTFQMTGNGN